MSRRIYHPMNMYVAFICSFPGPTARARFSVPYPPLCASHLPTLLYPSPARRCGSRAARAPTVTTNHIISRSPRQNFAAQPSCGKECAVVCSLSYAIAARCTSHRQPSSPCSLCAAFSIRNRLGLSCAVPRHAFPCVPLQVVNSVVSSVYGSVAPPLLLLVRCVKRELVVVARSPI